MRSLTTPLGEMAPLSGSAPRLKASARILSVASIDRAWEGGDIPRGDAEEQDTCSDIEVRRPGKPEVLKHHVMDRCHFKEGL
jgi:hypothetical protein